MNKEPPFHPKKRRAARRYAMQAIYQWQLTQYDPETITEQFQMRHEDDAVEWSYFVFLLSGVVHDLDEIDAQIETHAHRPLSEITLVELAVLRLAAYELLHAPSIPFKVVINEALELTKCFGSQDGFKFVNGLLDQWVSQRQAP